MDELDLLAELRGDTPRISTGAARAARARLIEAMAAPERPPRWVGPAVWRTGLVAAFAVAIVIGTVFFEGDTPAPGRGPGLTGVLPIAQPAVAAVAERARTVAGRGPADRLEPTAWVYVETLQRESQSHEMSTLSDWYTLDGLHSAGVDDRGRLNVFHAEPLRDVPSQAFLLDAPDDAEGMARHVYAEVDRIIRGERDHTIRLARVDTSRGRDVAAFTLVQTVLKYFYATPRQQAALYGALAYIPGVEVVDDVADAAGRHGQAFGITDSQSVRSEIILDKRTYRYLGTRAIFTKDWTEPSYPPDISPDSDPAHPLHFPKGTVIELTAKVASGIVGGPGERDERGQRP
ncbi:hypothetical protein GCM10023194_36450 [Planotetraspora phitsanulokensis]|uniref:CU044_5270 family protein n=1 Tax=Planotetraspora phitsanulokensis TaxID=575192 RepID=A0A8J3XH65_9ACTN|nr:CU044_5270 family protein [Planotetraspora phitsanulokensis]GII36228.1 hypothetical protein Pph01_12310 [Planotetraspora phitsanulokensis]